jgi:tRNA dimethylallyltransferase
MQDITARGLSPLMVGGTMLYFKALQQGLSDLPQADAALRAELDEKGRRLGWPALHQELAGLDPVTARRLEPTDAQRIQRAIEVCLLAGRPMSELLGREQVAPLPYGVIAMALLPGDRAVLHSRIAQRFDAMLRQGLIEEVEWLRAHYALTPNMPSMRCVGYRQAWQYLDGDLDRAALLEKGTIATRQLAKRQLTWLRSMPGVAEFDCLAPDLAGRVRAYLLQILEV